MKDFDLLPENIKRRVAITPCPKPELGDCWLWTGCVRSEDAPYGHITINKTARLVHRYVYQLLRSVTLTYDQTIDHLCRVKLCCNPEHLEVVSRGENVLRGIGISANNARKTHCVRNHPFSPENTYITPNGRRQCRTCGIIIRQRFKERHCG
jgi:hypothetical protein